MNGNRCGGLSRKEIEKFYKFYLFKEKRYVSVIKNKN